MAKKTVASLHEGSKEGRAYTKVIKMVKSPKTGAYVFDEDVYKRQNYSFIVLGRVNHAIIFYGFHALKIRVSPRETLIFKASAFYHCSCCPVSYTHLDVYKRQL